MTLGFLGTDFVLSKNKTASAGPTPVPVITETQR
jgi:hypothetical protein